MIEHRDLCNDSGGAGLEDLECTERRIDQAFARWLMKIRIPFWIVAVLTLGVAGLAPPARPSYAADADKSAITVFAAASLTDALQELGDGFTNETSIPVRFSFAASSALARQIENGAPADVFFSADLEWMDYLQSRNLIQRDTRRDVLGNRLVLIAPVDSLIKLKIEPHFVDRKS